MLSDANAVLIDGRVLVQHQAALSLIRTWTQDPAIPRIRWLDLACGRGQILSNLDHVIPEKRREKIEYRGFDVSKEFALQAERRARSLFQNASVNICELQFFETFLAGEESFDIVTCTNAVHEISPEALAETFVGAICRTGSQGCLYLYDMERLTEQELGAIPWKGKEVEQVFHSILTAAGVDESALPDVAIWPHKQCTCWNLQLHRNHLSTSELNSHRPAMISAGAAALRNILQDKLLELHTALNAASRYGTETLGDRSEVQRALYDHWAIYRSLNQPIRGTAKW